MEQTRRFPGFGQTLLLMLAAICLIVGLTIPVAVADFLFKMKLVEHPGVMGCINLAAFGAVLILGALLAKAPLREVFPMKPVRPALALPLILSVLGAVIVLSEADNWMRTVLPMPQWLAKVFADLIMAKNSFWGALFALAIVAPVTEELFFRGLVMHGFLSRYSVRNSVLISSVLFGLIHLNPWQLISGVALGLLLGWWFVRTRSLLPCLAGHALANSTLLFASFFPLRISGFNAGSPLDRTVEFQPLWFNLLGLALLVAGVWLFAAWSRKPPVETGASNSPVG
ncbi:MAG: CPBP family intramembrane metalloprotease [Verrucomicrobia bacterium]|nr:CPBP family intramembrane metalloprotease [Verrucomicrobiota bacterium]